MRKPRDIDSELRALADKAEYSVVHRVVHPDGQTRHVREHGRVFTDPATGLPLRLIGTVQYTWPVSGSKPLAASECQTMSCRVLPTWKITGGQ